MYCIYVWRPIMEAISTLENIRPPIHVYILDNYCDDNIICKYNIDSTIYVIFTN